MNGPNCQHVNSANARFCAQCGAPLTPAAPSATPATSNSAPPAAISGSNKAALVVLGVIFGVLLLFVVGIYNFFHMVANKVRALASGDAQTTEQSSNPASADADAQRGARATGNVIGSLLGTDAKGRSDIGKALDNMAQSGRQIEQHDKAAGNANGAPDAADTQRALGAAGGLMGALGSSLGGAHRHDPVDFHALEALLPSSLPGMRRDTPEGNANQAIGIKATSADVDFRGPNDAHINVSIKDATALSGLAGLAEMANANESEQGDSYEKNETIAGRSVHEKWDAASKHGELSLIVGKRYGVVVEGNNVDMGALRTALGQVDLARLESMKDANAQ